MCMVVDYEQTASYKKLLKDSAESIAVWKRFSWHWEPSIQANVIFLISPYRGTKVFVDDEGYFTSNRWRKSQMSFREFLFGTVKRGIHCYRKNDYQKHGLLVTRPLLRNLVPLSGDPKHFIATSGNTGHTVFSALRFTEYSISTVIEELKSIRLSCRREITLMLSEDIRSPFNRKFIIEPEKPATKVKPKAEQVDVLEQLIDFKPIFGNRYGYADNRTNVR